MMDRDENSHQKVLGLVPLTDYVHCDSFRGSYTSSEELLGACYVDPLLVAAPALGIDR